LVEIEESAEIWKNSKLQQKFRRRLDMTVVGSSNNIKRKKKQFQQLFTREEKD
jgi:hypothetical protein